MHLNVTSELLELGLASSAVVARGVNNTRISPELIAYRRYVGKRLAAHWKKRLVSAHPVICEYHRVHELFGVVDEPPAPEKLIMHVRRNHDFTSSGAIVDCYNIVSAKTLLSIGAHDIERVASPVSLRQCGENDAFIPLGQVEAQAVAGEYGYVDAERRVICRLDVLQCEYSKTTRDSRDVIFFLQGNRRLSSSALLKGTWYLAEVIERFTGGRAEIVGFLDMGGARTIGSSKPEVTFNDCKGLNLRKATVVRSDPVPEMPALSAVTVKAQSEVQVLAPTASLPAEISGHPVVIAGGLHPVKVGANQFGAYLMTVNVDAAASPLIVESVIPDGMRLY